MGKQRQPFDGAGEFVATQRFTFHGVDYEPGSEFATLRKAIGMRHAHKLYNRGLLEMKPLRARPRTRAAVPAPQADAGFIFNPVVHEIRLGRRGPGTIISGAEGEQLLRVSRTEAKRLQEVVFSTKVDAAEVLEG